MIQIPDFDEMSPKQVREWGYELIHAANQHGEIRATLIVNCEEGRPLHKLGIRYDKQMSTIRNLVLILEKLLDKIGDDDGQ